MSIRSLLVVLLALICGGAAAVGVTRILGTAGSGRLTPQATVPVVVATAEISRGTMLKPELVAIKEFPENLVPAGTHTDVETVVERAALTSFVAGQPILENNVGDHGLGAAALIRPGMRAYTIHTPTESSGVGGLLLPGNRVDVLLTMTGRTEERSGGGSTATLLQNVEILAAGQDLGQNESQNAPPQQLRSVTLLVTPDMATKLTLAQTMGTLNLTLRNDSDKSVAETTPITMNELRFLEEAMRDEADVPPTLDATAVTNRVGKPVVNPGAIMTLRGNTSGRVYLGGR